MNSRTALPRIRNHEGERVLPLVVRSRRLERLRVVFLLPLLMGAITPFLVLLVVALIFNFIPMDGKLKQIGYIIIGVVALVMLLQLVL